VKVTTDPALKAPMHFRFRVNARGGGHVHLTVYAGTTPGSLGRSGGLVLREAEWTALQLALSGNREPGVLVHIEDP
jgi:hypothetical protein